MRWGRQPEARNGSVLLLVLDVRRMALTYCAGIRSECGSILSFQPRSATLSITAAPFPAGPPGHVSHRLKAMPCQNQGFYLYKNPHRLEPDVGDARRQGLTLVWGKIDLTPFREQPELPADFLTRLDAGFDIARNQGMKVIVRASYGHQGAGGDYSTYEDPAEEILLGHIRQLAPLFAKNADVIALFEAGFGGPWGEWHGTAIARDYGRGRDMLMYLLAHTPRDRMVLVRYPYLKQQKRPCTPFSGARPVPSTATTTVTGRCRN